MKKPFYIKLYEDYPSYMEPLTDEEVGKLVRGMMAYAFRGIAPIFDPVTEMGPYCTWPIYKWRIDEDQRLHEALAERSRKNGRLGGRPKRPLPDS